MKLLSLEFTFLTGLFFQLKLWIVPSHLLLLPYGHGQGKDYDCSSYNLVNAVRLKPQYIYTTLAQACYNPLLKSVLVFNMISVCSWSRALIYMSTALSNYNLIQFRQKERIFQVWKENILTSLKMARIRRNKNFPDGKIFNVKTFRKKARKSSVNWSYCWWIKGRFLEAVVVQRETALGRLHKKKSYSTTSFTNKWLLAIYCNAMHKVNSGFPNL